MTSVHKTKKVQSKKLQEKEEKKIERCVLELEEMTERLEHTFEKIVTCINTSREEVVASSNPPGYSI
jgi:hypothetical protein